MIITTFNDEKYNKENKKISIYDFLNINIEDIIVKHHFNNSHTTYLYLKDESYLLIISQNKSIIKKFNMIEKDEKFDPNRSHDIFNYNPFLNLKIQHLIPQLLDNNANFQLNYDNNSYSFQLLNSFNCEKMIKKLNNLLLIKFPELLLEQENKQKKRSKLL